MTYEESNCVARLGSKLDTVFRELSAKIEAVGLSVARLEAKCPGCSQDIIDIKDKIWSENEQDPGILKRLHDLTGFVQRVHKIMGWLGWAVVTLAAGAIGLAAKLWGGSNAG